MPIRTDSIYNLRNQPRQPGDSVRILVMRKWPRGIKKTSIDFWIPEAGPSDELLQQLRAQEITWEQFAEAYRVEQLTERSWGLYANVTVPTHQLARTVQNDQKPHEWLRWLAQHQEQGIMLICWEREGHCHRHILEELVKEQPS